MISIDRALELVLDGLEPLGAERAPLAEAAGRVAAEPALGAVVREFGDVLAPDGTLDRKKLAAIVFADPGRRRRLEGILHPAIRARFDARLEALAREGFDGLVIFDAPVMIESGGYKHMDRLVVVVTDEATQRARLVARDADAADGERRIASQMPLAEKVKLADYVIDNSGDRAATQARTREVHAALLADLAARRSAQSA